MFVMRSVPKMAKVLSTKRVWMNSSGQLGQDAGVVVAHGQVASYDDSDALDGHQGHEANGGTGQELGPELLKLPVV